MTPHTDSRLDASWWQPLISRGNTLKPATLQLLMRHRSIETTMRYYVFQEADEIADELWGRIRCLIPQQGKLRRGQGNILGNIPPRRGIRKRKSFQRVIIGSSFNLATYISGGQGIRTLNRFPGT